MTRALAAATLCAVLVGCGGDEDGSGYERVLNSFCSAMTKGAAKVQADSAQLQTAAPQERLKGVSGVLGTFATTMERAGAKLRDIDVPEDYKRLNADIVKGVDGYVGTLRKASREAANGNAAAARSLGSSLKGELPAIPTGLAKKTPACSS